MRIGPRTVQHTDGIQHFVVPKRRNPKSPPSKLVQSCLSFRVRFIHGINFQGVANRRKKL